MQMHAAPASVLTIATTLRTYELVCYADDVVIFASLVDTLTDALAIFGEEATPLGLAVNWAKTKIQSLSD